MTDRQKITDGHRRRRAVVYVRQSTPTQVERNAESVTGQFLSGEREIAIPERRPNDNGAFSSEQVRIDLASPK